MKYSLQFDLNNRLWKEIKQNYENKDFSGAIRDAVLHLTEIVRERTNLKLDGTKLVKKAFNPNEPLLKVNPMRTASEKSEQEGVYHILMGIYLTVRNPRFHEKFEDDKITCNTIISFFSYLIDIIEKAEAKFDINSFCEKVFDPYFVEKEEYSSLLVSEIPNEKKLDVLFKLFDNKNLVKPQVFKLVALSIRKGLTKEEWEEFVKYCENILSSSSDPSDFEIIISIFEKTWEELNLKARMRAENKLINFFQKGLVNDRGVVNEEGDLGKLILTIYNQLNLKKEFRKTLIKKLACCNYWEKEYVFNFFQEKIIPENEKCEHVLVKALVKGLKEGDVRFYNLMIRYHGLKAEILPEDVKVNLEKFEEKNLKPQIDPDEVPF